jgi:hypothetical protein
MGQVTSPSDHRSSSDIQRELLMQESELMGDECDGSWLIIMEFGLSYWNYTQLLLQSLVITINYKNSQSIFNRTLLPGLPRTRPILILVLRLASHEWVSELYYDRRSVGQSVLISSPHLGRMTRFLLLSDTCGFVNMGRPLWREDGCLLQLLLSSPAQSFSGPSPAGLMTSFYCLRFETPPTWSTRSLYLYPPGTGWPGYNPRHWVWLLI